MKLVEDNLNQTTCQLIRPTVQRPEFQLPKPSKPRE